MGGRQPGMNKRKPNLVRPTGEEEAEIAAQLAEDPDTYEWTEEDWANGPDHPGTLPRGLRAGGATEGGPEGRPHPAGDRHPGPGDDSLVQGPDRGGRGDRRDAVAGTGRTDPAGPCPSPRRPEARGLSSEATC